VGAIKPTYIKSLGKKLLKEVPDFTDDFDVNKKLVEEYTNVKSKGVRNRIAGYVTHKKVKESKEE
jgi:small subunit ribosomal protein S17e